MKGEWRVEEMRREGSRGKGKGGEGVNSGLGWNGIARLIDRLRFQDDYIVNVDKLEV